MRARRTRTLAWMVMVSGFAVPSPVLAEAAVVNASEVMRVAADHSAGLRLLFDGPASLPEGGISVVGGNPAKLLVAFGPDCWEGEGDPTTCIDLMYMETSDPAETWEWGTFGASFPPDWIYELYIVTDTPVVLELRFEGPAGVSYHQASGETRAWFERLPSSCSSVACGDVNWGGVAHDVGLGGFTGVFARSMKERESLDDSGLVPNAGLSGVIGCLYPTSWLDPSASPDPEHHPYGCNLDPLATEGRVNLIHTVTWGVSTWGAGTGGWTVDYNARGRVYAGFNGTHRTIEDGGSVRAYGVWISNGVG